MVTVSLMLLLALLAVGLLSLSTVGLRSSSRLEAQRTAQANARLALEMAIGQLQRHAGPDQRITAEAGMLGDDTVATEARAWTGLWRSSPSTPTNFDPGRPEAFDRWLVTHGSTTGLDDVSRGAGAGDSGAVTMVRRADGSSTRVPAARTPDGRLAWWTSDESMKAPLDLPRRERDTEGERLARLHAPERPAPEIGSGLEDLDPEPALTSRLVTLSQVGLAVDDPPATLGEDFTVATRAVLGNVRRGGLKRDLSTLLELPADSVPREFGAWTGRNSLNDRKAYLYGRPGVALGARWNHLHAFYNLYKDIIRRDGTPYIEPSDGLIEWGLADSFQDFGDEAGGFRFPRIAKIIYVFSYTSKRVDPREYQLELGTDIFVTLWNPFDTGILFPANTTFFTKFSKGLPFRFQWYLNGRARGSPTALQQIADGTPLFVKSEFLNPDHGRLFHMGPGETLVFSMRGSRESSRWGTQPEFRTGIHFRDGITSDGLLGQAGQLRGTRSDRVSVSLEPVEDVSAYTLEGQPTSQYVDFWIYDSERQWPYYEHRGELIAKNSTPFAQTMEAISENRVPAVSLAAVNRRRQPFAAFVIETRTANESKAPVPAFLHTGNARLSSRLGDSLPVLAYERLEYSLEPISGWDSDLIQATLPGDPAGAHHGYIGSGRGPATGRTHMTSHSIPAVPPVSLAAFRHAGTGDGSATLRATYWDFNSSPNPPYADSAVGNSYAHPLLRPDQSRDGDEYDHSFLVNEALWDDWFLSSLSPRTRGMFGEDQPIDEVWREAVEGGKSLLNLRMRPHLGGRTAEEIEKELLDPRTGIDTRAFEVIGAHLMIDGPFNVNSTSVEAWASFLASTRGAEIERIGGPAETAEGTLFSRTERVVAGAVDDGGGLEAHYGGFRDLSDEQIRELAVEVVAEVRKRGPFLNLAEFVNRRLADDPALALSGALQTAIDRSGLNDEVAAAATTGQAAPLGARVPNRDAATLSTAAGAPGWLMQGDILDPLGPFITVRGDTFVVRGYGEARDAGGGIRARAWCEAVVQRFPEFLDPSDRAETWPPQAPLNNRFGRRFKMVSFRWISSPSA